MDTAELLRRVRRIEIKTRRLSDHLFSGEYHASFKGRGMAFSEVRQYQVGDDIRSIDWNVTARKQEPFIKVFEEERELTLILLVDVSASGEFGTRNQIKREMATEVAATMAFSAIQNNDKVGVIFFSDHVEKFIPPGKGRQHILQIIRELIEFKATGQGTDIAAALHYLAGIQKKRAIVMILSDFIDNEYQKPLKIIARKHDVVALHLSDPAEWVLPSLGIVPLQDPETGAQRWINTSSSTVRKRYRTQRNQYRENLERACRSAGIGRVYLQTNRDYVKALLGYFKGQ